MVERVICTCPVVYRYILICTQKCSWCPFPKRYKQFGKTCLTLKFRPPWRIKSIFGLICTPFSLKQDVHLSITLYLNSFFDLDEDGRTKDRKKLPPSLLYLLSLRVCVCLVPVGLSCLSYVFTLPTPTPPRPKLRTHIMSTDEEGSEYFSDGGDAVSKRKHARDASSSLLKLSKANKIRKVQQNPHPNPNHNPSSNPSPNPSPDTNLNPNVKMKKSTFTADVCEQTGLEIVDSGRLNSRPASKCTLCGHVMMNMLNRWQRHAKHCLLKFQGSKSGARGVALSNGVAKPTAFQLQITAAAEQNRKKLCDTYVAVYWLYQNNISFNIGPKLKKVLPPPPPPHPTHIHTHTPRTHMFVLCYFTPALLFHM